MHGSVLKSYAIHIIVRELIWFPRKVIAMYSHLIHALKVAIPMCNAYVMGILLYHMFFLLSLT